MFLPCISHYVCLTCCLYTDQSLPLCVPSQVLAVVLHSKCCLWDGQEDLSEAETVQGAVPRPPAEDWSLTSYLTVFTFQQGLSHSSFLCFCVCLKVGLTEPLTTEMLNVDLPWAGGQHGAVSVRAIWWTSAFRSVRPAGRRAVLCWLWERLRHQHRSEVLPQGFISHFCHSSPHSLMMCSYIMELLEQVPGRNLVIVRFCFLQRDQTVWKEDFVLCFTLPWRIWRRCSSVQLRARRSPWGDK